MGSETITTEVNYIKVYNINKIPLQWDAYRPLVDRMYQQALHKGVSFPRGCLVRGGSATRGMPGSRGGVLQSTGGCTGSGGVWSGVWYHIMH